MASVDPKEGVLLYVKRNGVSTFVVLKDSKDGTTWEIAR